MKRYGFNFQWMFSKREDDSLPIEPDLKALDFLADHGFNFARIPTDYRFWTKGFDYLNPDESIFEFFDRYLDACAARGIQMSLNLHRAPGYCINRNDLEKHDLWTDAEAQDAFVFLWETFSRRYQGRSNDEISFDLLNEPPNEGWALPHSQAFNRDIHAKVMRRTAAAIRAIDPDREIVCNGIGGGGTAIPELADLGVIHSGRGYAPFYLTHYRAPWSSNKDATEDPTWPLNQEDETWDKDKLREYYAPWREVEDQGVRIHIGEFGCFIHTPNEAAMGWFSDLFSLYKEFGWGYSLWTFEGSFGIMDHGRPGAVFEEYKGYKLDRGLFDLVLKSRIQ